MKYFWHVNCVTYGFDVEPKGKTTPQIEQIHSSQIVKLGPHLEKADAVWTDSLEAVYVFTADCLPILLHGSKRDPVAAIHCGWRGALDLIVSGTRSLLRIPDDRFSFIIGPCIKACCFEVKSDFVNRFKMEGFEITRFLSQRGDQQYFDLVAWVCDTQIPAVAKRRRTIDPRCTRCHPSLLPSYRRTLSTDSRIRSWIRKNPIP